MIDTPRPPAPSEPAFPEPQTCPRLIPHWNLALGFRLTPRWTRLLLDFGVRFGLTVGQRKSLGIEDLDFASHGLKKTCRFEGQKPAVRTLTQGSVEQQEPWQVSRRDADRKSILGRYVEEVCAQGRQRRLYLKHDGLHCLQ